MDKFNNFIQKADKVHNGFYSYKNVNYINARKKIVITCPKHGDFEQLPYNHLMGKGCNKCSIESNKKKFTKSLSDFINQSNNIKYERQKKFDDCVKNKKLSFDFWIFEKNILIEFDGLQHFLPLGFQGGLKKLEYTKECDKIKDEYCIAKNIRLLRISYK